MENLKLRSGSMAKPPLGIVPMRALVGVSRVLEDGYVFYAPGNWAEQPLEDAAQAYDNGEQRHRMQSQPLNGLMTPQSLATLDADSGLPHIDHQIAGLVILRALMIRDGVLPEDPGVGNRKRKAMQPVPVAQRFVEYVEQKTIRNTTTISDAPDVNEDLRRMAEHIASRDYPSIVDPLQMQLKLDERQTCDDCPYQDGGCVGCDAPERALDEPKTSDYCVTCGDSPDSGSHLPHGHDYVDPRQRAAEENIKKIQAETRQQTEEKQQRDREVADRARVRSEGMKW